MAAFFGGIRLARGVAVSVSFRDTVLSWNEGARDRPAKCGTIPGNLGHVVTLVGTGMARYTNKWQTGIHGWSTLQGITTTIVKGKKGGVSNKGKWCKLVMKGCGSSVTLLRLSKCRYMG